MTKFFHLDGSSGWRNGSTLNVAQSRTGLQLGTNPNGPLSLKKPGLGRLRLPRKFAIDQDGRTYLLTNGEVKRFNLNRGRFEILPLAGRPWNADASSIPSILNASRFKDASAVDIAGRNLYVVEAGNCRVQVFDIYSLVLKHVWAFNQPIDLFVQGKTAFILDQGSQVAGAKVYQHRVGQDHLSLIFEEEGMAGLWDQIVVDQSGLIYLHRHNLNEGAQTDEKEESAKIKVERSRLDLYGPDGVYLGIVEDAAEIRDRFPSPAIHQDQNGNFSLSPKLHRIKSDAETPQAKLIESHLHFNRFGELIAPPDPTAPLGPYTYCKQGKWISESLDSEIYNCQWHQIELEMASMPLGSQLVLRTFSGTYSDTLHAILTDPNHNKFEQLWVSGDRAQMLGHVVTGQMQPRNDKRERLEDERISFLVQNREGQHLWLRLDFSGDGYVTPIVKSIRIHYPRQSYLQYLPSIFAADDDSRWFMERFLSIFQAEWDAIEDHIGKISQYFDPHTVPDGPFLHYLANWLALPLEGRWDADQKRHLLEAAPSIYPERGTLTGLKHFLKIVLENMQGKQLPDGAHDFPQILEGFQARQRLFLGAEGTASLDHGASLWGPAIVGRLQLDVFSKVGEVRLVSTGSPERDYFDQFAHRFQVFIPAPWLKSATDEEMFKRAIESEKPAHTAYELRLIEPRFQIGWQSTIGFDTIIGGLPETRLAATEKLSATDSIQNQPAPSRLRSPILGYDTVLASGPVAAVGPRLNPALRIGSGTVLG